MNTRYPTTADVRSSRLIGKRIQATQPELAEAVRAMITHLAAQSTGSERFSLVAQTLREALATPWVGIYLRDSAEATSLTLRAQRCSTVDLAAGNPAERLLVQAGEAEQLADGFSTVVDACAQGKKGARHRMLLVPIAEEGRLLGALAFTGNDILSRWSADKLAIAGAAADALRLHARAAVPGSHPARRQTEILTSPGLVWSVDSAGRWTFLSPIAQKIFGRPPEELLGTVFTEFQNGFHRRNTSPVITQLRLGQPVSGCRTAFERPDGCKAVLLYSAMPIHDEHGRLIGATGTASDVTELTADADAVDSLADRSEPAVKVTKEAIWDLEPTSGALWLNACFNPLFDSAPGGQKTSIRRYLRRVHPDDRHWLFQNLRDALHQQRSQWSIACRFRVSAERYTTLVLRSFVLYGETGVPVRMLGTARSSSGQRGHSDATRNRMRQLARRLQSTHQVEDGAARPEYAPAEGGEHPEQKRARLRHLAQRLQSAREEERALIARELHDEFAQALTALKLDLNWLQGNLDKPGDQLEERVDEMSRLIEQTMAGVWRMASDLRPKILDELGLRTALQYQVERFSERTGITCELAPAARFQIPDLPREFEVAIYRLFQEALSNIARHSHATKVRISARLQRGRLELSICDNGQGIPPEKIYDANSLGLSGMRERAELLDGSLEFEAPAAGGTCVRLRISLP